MGIIRRLAAALVAVGLAATACTGHATPRPPGAAHTSPSAAHLSSSPAASCATSVQTGALPTWARFGFTPSNQAIPHVLGAGGDIVSVLFGQPLTSPPPQGRSNKILWVSRPAGTGDDLKIDATLPGTGLRASRQVSGGPGLSNIDLPAPGCWSLTLSWSGHQDRMTVPYYPG